MLMNVLPCTQVTAEKPSYGVGASTQLSFAKQIVKNGKKHDCSIAVCVPASVHLTVSINNT